MTTKRSQLEAGETLEVDYSGAYTAYASENAYEMTDDGISGGDWGISYHKGEMPAIGSENFASIDELLAKMREIAPLNRWRISHPE